ncbi:hypothetical protein LI322_27865, partial [Bacteroides cellulosilyticus]|uniref:hypothetical protein n=1 Tax=Bacteroides cellulosilyticus TaxID=246787 RepID=UPI001D05C894
GSGQYQYCEQYENLPNYKEEIYRKVHRASASNRQDASKVYEILEVILLCRVKRRNVLYYTSKAVLKFYYKNRK